jgi:structural maintenance of chromosome 4
VSQYFILPIHGPSNVVKQGRLGSLGTIDEKYDIAISTACGQLNNLVVDTVDQAQQCIEYLRAQNIGRATFMVLEKLSQDHGMNPKPTPENAPRLYDLVKPRETRFAPAFYKALRDTLVASDLDQANRIAYGATRWRVVTLAGQMFETSGTMSGGGGQPQRGGMSSKFAGEAVRPEVIQQYERDSADAQRHLEQATQEAREAEVELDRLKKLGPELDMSFQKLGLEIETGKRSISEAEKRVRDLK